LFPPENTKSPKQLVKLSHTDDSSLQHSLLKYKNEKAWVLLSHLDNDVDDVDENIDENTGWKQLQLFNAERRLNQSDTGIISFASAKTPL
jgi:hypothetical protein